MGSFRVFCWIKRGKDHRIIPTFREIAADGLSYERWESIVFQIDTASRRQLERAVFSLENKRSTKSATLSWRQQKQKDGSSPDTLKPPNLTSKEVKRKCDAVMQWSKFAERVKSCTQTLRGFSRTHYISSINKKVRDRCHHCSRR